MVRQEPHRTPPNIFAMPSELKNEGRARLLPSWRRHGSAGASPSRVMNWLDKVDEDMFTGVASPSHENAVPKLEFETALVLEHAEVIQVRAGSEPQLAL